MFDFKKKLPDTLRISTQKEFNSIPLDYKGRIEIAETKGEFSIKHGFENAYMVVSGNATIESVSDNATIKYVYDNATIKYVYGNATIKYVYGNATILLFGLASIVLLYGAKKITTKGINLVRQIGKIKIDMELSKETTFVQIKETISENPTLNFYKKLYPVEEKNKKLIFYKAVHKYADGTYHSDYNKDFIYKIGEVMNENCDTSTDESCTNGIHISHKFWAITFGRAWEDMALLECEVNPKDIVVAKDCDGKVRTSKLKIIREVPKEEY